jgi:outer membrane protein OmpA-like peptidoglycan-associated protein
MAQVPCARSLIPGPLRTDHLRNFAMFTKAAIKTLPFSVLLLAACAASTPRQPLNAAPDSAANSTSTSTSTSSPQPTVADSAAVQTTSSNPGYDLFNGGEFDRARATLQSGNSATPNDAYIQLDLGATYQRQGRMDLAVPLYRQAMVNGHDVVATRVSMPKLQGQTIEQIACYNLSIGLAPATVAGTAERCQTSVISVVDPVSSKTYFAFDKSTLTRSGRRSLRAVAQDARTHPTLKVAIVGKASKTGSDAYNMSLSKRRADTVRDALIADGVAADQIDTRWVGDRELAVAEREGVHEPLNRVVETESHVQH